MSFLTKDPKDATLALLRLECFVPNADGALVNEGGFPGLVESLAPHFGRIEVVAPVVPRLEVSAGLRPIEADNVVFRALPDMKGLARSWARSREALKRIAEWAPGWDMVNLRAPDNFLPVIAPWLRRANVPHYVQMVSHPFDAGASATAALRPLARPLGAAAWRLQRHAIRRAVEGRLCIAHGDSLRAIAQGWGAHAVNLPSGSLRRAAIDPTPRVRAPRKLLFVGRLNTEKGLFVLVDALAELEARGVLEAGMGVTLAGWPTGDFGARLEAYAGERGVRERLAFVGPVPHGPELFELYRAHDVFVLPSISEGTPRVIGEAMAFGLPVVSTTAGGIPDLVADGRTGLLVAPGDARALAAALERVLTDGALRARLVQNAAATVDARTLEHRAAQHVALVCGTDAGALGLAPSAEPERAGGAA